MATKRGDRRTNHGAKKAGGKTSVRKTTVELERNQDRALELIKLHYRDLTPRIDKKTLIRKAVDLLIAEFDENKDFLLPGDK